MLTPSPDLVNCDADGYVSSSPHLYEQISDLFRGNGGGPKSFQILGAKNSSNHQQENRALQKLTISFCNLSLFALKRITDINELEKYLDLNSPGHPAYNFWVSKGLERFRVLASGRVYGRARGKRSISKRLLTQELEALYRAGL